MVAIIRTIFYFGPLLFGIGFITPLTAQIIEQMAWTPPFGLSALAIGLIIGGTLGLFAQIRGRWV